MRREVDGQLLERTFGPPGTTPFQAARTDWTYGATDGQDRALFHAALATPLEHETGLAGTLAVFSTTPGAFEAKHAADLHALLDEAAVGLSNARRFADIEARTLLNPATGVPNPRGYEVELGREVARAHRTGRPLSVVLVGIGGNATTGSSEQARNGVAAVAQLLTRVTRKSDISCRRGEREFAILLPETRAAGATTLTSRLQEEAQRTLGVGRSTLTVDFVEWRPNETLRGTCRACRRSARPLDLALATATTRCNASRWAGRRPPSRRAREPGERDRRCAPAGALPLSHRARRRRVRRHRRETGREVADTVLAEVAARLDESLGAGASCVHRLGADEFVLVLPSTTAKDAEALLGALHGSLEPPPGVRRVTLGAGITELGDVDDAETVLERAEHALEQAQQVGNGAVVVAVPGIASPRPG